MKQILLFSGLILLNSISFAADKITISSGNFMMGCSIADTNCDVDEGSLGGTKVFVPEFKIDKNEVTVAEYENCIKNKQCSKPKDFKRNKYCNLNAPDRSNHPINCVDWSQAKAYCDSVGGRLPHEAEWEKAARAGTTSRYPWGQEVSCKNAILDDGKTMGSVANEPDGCGEDRTWTVASRPANKFGLFDMHGNAGEWTNTWYAKNAIKEMYAKGNLQGPKISKQKLVRGGSWDENKVNLRSSFRNVKPPISGNTVYGSIGFRCVYP